SRPGRPVSTSGSVCCPPPTGVSASGAGPDGSPTGPGCDSSSPPSLTGPRVADRPGGRRAPPPSRWSTDPTPAGHRVTRPAHRRSPAEHRPDQLAPQQPDVEERAAGERAAGEGGVGEHRGVEPHVGEGAVLEDRTAA